MKFYCPILIWLLLFTASSNGDPIQSPEVKDAMVWHDLAALDLEGQGWKRTKAPYDRLPVKAEGTVRGPVWSLSRHSAGLALRFLTDATAIHARWSLTSSRLAMPHMPATGVSGLDLYVKTDAGNWRWLANGRPVKQSNSVQLAGGMSQQEREYLLYLPLYNGVTKVELGFSAGSIMSQPPERPSGRTKPIVFYGTSITQGACASRPGMTHAAILGRWLDCPVINLGFSGNGKMESEMADLLAELDPSIYVLDCLPNMNAELLAERVVPFVHRLRQSRPETPILLVEDRSYANSFLIDSKRQINRSNRAELKKAYEILRASGVKGLYYLPGEQLLGDDGEGTVDSSHPNDLGFIRLAEAFRSALEPILRSAPAER